MDGKAYLLGIIDPLTKFTLRKEAEFQLKKMRHGYEMSCVPPDAYATRFRSSMKQYIQLVSKQKAKEQQEIQLSRLSVIPPGDN